MIEQLLANKDTIPYALACGCIVLAVVLGYLLGHPDPGVICADYIIQEQEATKKAIELNEELTECRAKKAGGAVIDCKAFCDDQTKKALENYKKIVCED